MGTIVTRWNDAVLDAIRTTHPGPPIVARALAVVHTCMYDAWAAYHPVAEGTRLGPLLRRPAAEHDRAHRRKAVAYAAHRAAVDLLPSEEAHFVALMADLGYDPADTSADPTSAAGVGNLAARAVLEFRHGDGSNQLGTLSPTAVPYSDWTGYRPRNTADSVVDPGRWQPLRVDDGHGGTVVQSFIAPHWGLVAPFALDVPIESLPGDPQQAGSEGYRTQCEDVLRYSAELTDRQKVIAEYWADGPQSELPPGHWCLFAHEISDRDGHGLNKDVRLFFALTNAVLDASILSWGLKRRFDYVRPVTAIHVQFGGQQVRAWAGPGQGTGMIDGADWRPYQAANVVTPPFPEYYSGHSIFSSAAAEVLRRFTGSDAFGHSVTVPAGSSRVEPGQVPATGTVLQWDTFTEAADEAGLSRRYGGIHFEDGDRAARAVGRVVDSTAWARADRYWSGTV
ncbi:MAG TPA: hypothetical protein VES95_03055 [Dermatophilaceae bacterium]|nr:hypothetical protein [Dermatophilaceae bacterium]